jgi:hypothetical protein
MRILAGDELRLRRRCQGNHDDKPNDRMPDHPRLPS